MEIAISVRDLRREYSHTWRLRIAALDVHRGELLAVIGPNGSGKSTLLRMLGLLEAPDAGEIRMGGQRVDAANGLVARRRMAVVFQQPLLADMTAAENVALGLRFRGVPRGEIPARIARWLGRFGIADLAGRAARTLSGGEAQRVALARALVLEPEVLLLDEPFTSLDQPTRTALIADLGGIVKTDRVTTVLVTHDRGEAQALADRVAVLIDGRIHQVDETARVFYAPVSEEVARFVGVETIVTGEVLACDAGVAVLEVAGRKVEVTAAARPGERLRVGIRPEDVTLAHPEERPHLSSARNCLAGTIVRVSASGALLSVVVDCGFPLVAAVTARSVTELGLAENTRIDAIFKASAAHVIGRVVP